MALLSDAIKEAYASAPSDVVVLHTLEIRHPDFTIPVFIVRDFENLVANLETGVPATFQALNFDFVLPDQTDKSSVPEIQVSIDNVSRELVPQLDLAVASLQPIEILYRPYLSSDLSAPHMNPPLKLILRDVEVNLTRVSAKATFGDFSNKSFPNKSYLFEEFVTLANQ